MLLLHQFPQDIAVRYDDTYLTHSCGVETLMRIVDDARMQIVRDAQVHVIVFYKIDIENIPIHLY